PSAGAPDALCVGGQSPTTVPDNGLAVTCRHPAGATGSPVDQHAAQVEVLAGEAAHPVRPTQLYDWIAVQLGGERRQSRWPADPHLPGFGDNAATGSVLGVLREGEPVRAGTPIAAGAQDAYLACWAAGLDTVGRALDPGGRTGGL